MYPLLQSSAIHSSSSQWHAPNGFSLSSPTVTVMAMADAMRRCKVRRILVRFSFTLRRSKKEKERERCYESTIYLRIRNRQKVEKFDSRTGFMTSLWVLRFNFLLYMIWIQIGNHQRLESPKIWRSDSWVLTRILGRNRDSLNARLNAALISTLRVWLW